LVVKGRSDGKEGDKGWMVLGVQRTGEKEGRKDMVIKNDQAIDETLPAPVPLAQLRDRLYTTRTQLPVIFFPCEINVIQVNCVTFPNHVRTPRATTFFSGSKTSVHAQCAGRSLPGMNPGLK
jgi:hypothetical protein